MASGAERLCPIFSHLYHHSSCTQLHTNLTHFFALFSKSTLCDKGYETVERKAILSLSVRITCHIGVAQCLEGLDVHCWKFSLPGIPSENIAMCYTARKIELARLPLTKSCFVRMMKGAYGLR